MPVDTACRAKDQWAQCTQGEGTVLAYIDRFLQTLLHVQDAVPAEVLDRFIRGLAPPVRSQVLVKTLSTLTGLHLWQKGWMGLTVNLPATLLPQAPSLWISEPCRDPPPVPVLTPEAEEMVVAVMTSALVITANSLATLCCPASS